MSTTPVLEVRDLKVMRNGRFTLAVDHLTVAEGAVLAVIGPNGSGKSTLLLALAQLLQPGSGQILFRGRPLQPRDNLAHRRRIGLVLQDPLLTDTSVFDNVALGLRFRRLPKAEINRRVKMWLARLDIAHLEKRPSRQLSGGEAQRVSLARAFAVQPEVLLLDEPFSALDMPTRVRLLQDLRALLADTGMTAVLVTHDMNEAWLLADQVAVLLDGRLRQHGSPDDVFTTPGDPDVAAFVDIKLLFRSQFKDK
jgi:tungstate transport system ATP-binding protein